MRREGKSGGPYEESRKIAFENLPPNLGDGEGVSNQKRGVKRMSRRTTGLGFIAIAAFLFSVKFLTAAIFGSGVSSWNADLFSALIDYVDQGIATVSLIALIAGLLYLAWAELLEGRGGMKGS